MSSRKRRRSCTSETQRDLSKRARINSKFGSPQEISTAESPSYSTNSSGTVYQIRGIIGERRGKYLIDWEDDLFTGQTFAPDWQPKRNANQTAVNIWETLKASRKEWARKDRGKLRKSSSYTSPSTANTPISRKRRIRLKAPSISIKSSNGSLQSSHLPAKSQGRRRSQPLNSPDLSGLIVQDSQHSSLDKNSCITIEPSLTSQGTFESSIRSESCHRNYQDSISQPASHQSSESNRIVNDSQSLPNSSSYVPSLSLSVGTRSTDRSVSLSLQATDIQADSQRSNRIIPISQESARIYRRSRSAPASTIPDSNSTSLSLARSSSDPYQVSQLSSQSQTSVCAELPDLAEKILEKADQIDEGIQHRFCQVASSTLLEDILAVSSDSKKEGRRLPSDAQISMTSGHPAQDRPSQATTTDDTDLSERNQGPLAQRGRSLHFAETSQLLEQYCSQDQVSQTPPLSIHPDCMEEEPQAFKQPAGMADVPMASREIIEDSGASSEAAPMTAKEKLKRQKAQAEAQIVRSRAERQRQSLAKQEAQSSPTSPSNRITGQKSPPAVRSPFLGNRQALPVYRTSPSRPYMPFEGLNIAPQPPRKPAAPSPGPSSPLARQHPLANEGSPTSQRSQASQSPSVIPDKPPYQVEEEPSRLEVRPLEINTVQTIPPPTRNVQPSPYTPITPSKLSFERDVSLSLNQNTLDICNLDKQEYAIHLSMPGRIQDIYCATIRHHKPTIRSFLESSRLERGIIGQVNSLLDELSKVTTHIDLQGSGPSGQESADPKCEADYANSCSGKFTFLGHLIGQMRNDELRLCIVAKSGVLMSILETYLIAKEVSFIRWEGEPDTPKNTKNEKIVKGKLKVLLLPSDLQCDSKNLQWTDLIVAFDESFNRQNFAVLDRKQVPPPVLHPVVYASLEHIDLCVPRALNPIERLRKLVLSLLQTQKRVGAFDNGDPEPATCAQVVAAFLNRSATSNSERSWPLPPMRSIENIRFIDSDSNLSDALSDASDDFKPDGQTRYWPNPIPPKLVNEREQNGKRPIDLEWGDSLETQAKKQKLARQSQAGHMDSTDNDSPNNLKERIKEAQERLATLENVLKKKTQLATDLQDCAGIRQHEYEKLHREHGDLRISYMEVSADLARSIQSLQELKNKNEILASANSDLQKQTRDLQDQLNNHPNPAIAAASRNEAQHRALEAEHAVLKKSHTSLSNDFNFTRDQYQKASAVAAEAATENQSLREENAGLRRKDEANLVENRRMRDAAITKDILREKERLKNTLKQRDAFIAKLEGDMADLKRGRAGVQTRGSSVQPRSPRGASRNASPAPAFLGGHGMARGGSGLGKFNG